MKRACRKSSVVGIVVGVVVTLMVLVLSSYINYLIAIRDTKAEKTVDSAMASTKNFAPINNASYTNKSLIDDPLCSALSFKYNDLNRRHEKQTIQFIVLSFIFLLTMIMIVIIFFCMNRKTNNDKQGTPVPVDVYVSVMTQTSTDL
jgi:flagellar basal body-associated protein FliL